MGRVTVTVNIISDGTIDILHRPKDLFPGINTPVHAVHANVIAKQTLVLCSLSPRAYLHASHTCFLSIRQNASRGNHAFTI